MLKMFFISCVSLMLSFCVMTTVLAKDQIYFYIDGQEQRYGGEVIFEREELYLPLKPILLKLHEVNDDWQIDAKIVNDFLRERQTALQCGCEVDAELYKIVPQMRSFLIKDDHRNAMIRIDDVRSLGFDVYYFEDEQILHVNSPNLAELANVRVGDEKWMVDQQFHVNWDRTNAGGTDFIGYIGEMHEYVYTDKYGYERKGEVPDLQIEIKDGRITYMITSTADYPTSKQIHVGDSIREVYRAYGTDYIREEVDGKNIVVYDTDFGSIWFIVQDQTVERIAYWSYHLRGFGEMKNVHR